jgi:hypothetical protein
LSFLEARRFAQRSGYSGAPILLAGIGDPGYNGNL